MTGNILKANTSIDFTIDHVGISVSNLDRSVDFYTKVFGFTCERIIDMPAGNGKVALLKKPGITIEMFRINGVLPLPEDRKVPGEDLKTLGVKHFALRVKNVTDAADYLRNNGVDFISEPVVGVRGLMRFFVKDPDGIPVELTEGPA